MALMSYFVLCKWWWFGGGGRGARRRSTRRAVVWCNPHVGDTCMQAGEPHGGFAPVVAAFLRPAVPPGKSLQFFQRGSHARFSGGGSRAGNWLLTPSYRKVPVAWPRCSIS